MCCPEPASSRGQAGCGLRALRWVEESVALASASARTGCLQDDRPTRPQTVRRLDRSTPHHPPNASPRVLVELQDRQREQRCGLAQESQAVCGFQALLMSLRIVAAQSPTAERHTGPCTGERPSLPSAARRGVSYTGLMASVSQRQDDVRSTSSLVVRTADGDAGSGVTVQGGATCPRRCVTALGRPNEP